MRKRPLLLLLLCLLLAVTAWADDEATERPAWPERAYAPYVYMGGYPRYMLTQQAEERGIRFFSLGFILNGVRDCHARWMGSVPVDQFILMRDLRSLRALGGDVIVSFGGAGGDELALICTEVDALTAEYQRVIDTLDVTHLDFDIEGDEIRDPASIARRSQAIAALQAANDGLVISFTLPVLPTGLTAEGLAVLESALAHGVEISVVNIMTMNFGGGFAPDRMGDQVIQAAESLVAQLATLYPDADEAALWGMVGLTPMIGVNDVRAEVFTLADAAQVTAFARARGVRLLSMWSLDRDKACANAMQVLLPDCSGIVQDDWAYSALFSTFSAAE